MAHTARESETAEVAVGDTVRIYHRALGAGGVSRTLQRGEYVIVRENRHGDWTVRDTACGMLHDVLRGDAEAV